MKRIFCALMTLILLLTKVPASADASIDASAAIMVDANSGQIIYEQNADKKLPIASVSKLLTMAVIHDELQDGQIKGNTKVKATPAIAAVSNDPEYSAIGLKTNHYYTVDELIDAAMIKSADGATLALATAGHNTVKQFNAKMVKKAHQIGMRHVKIVNPVGLTNDQLKQMKAKGIARNAENEMTAKDAAILGSYLVHTYPDLMKVTSRTQESFNISKGNVKTLKNLNEMLPGGKYTVPGVTINGLKTGTSDKAGACFVSSGIYQGHNIITVVLHANGDNHDNRFIQTQQLYQMLKTSYHLQTIVLPQRVIKPTVKHAGQKNVQLHPGKVTIWRKQPLHHYTIGVQLNRHLINHHDELVAPIKKDQMVGKIRITGSQLKSINDNGLSYRIYSSQTVKHANLLQRLFH